MCSCIYSCKSGILSQWKWSFGSTPASKVWIYLPRKFPDIVWMYMLIRKPHYSVHSCLNASLSESDYSHPDVSKANAQGGIGAESNLRKYTDTRLNHIVLVDEDASRLHRAHMWKDCRSVKFQAILDDSHFEGKSTEKIVCQLRCKAIVNIASLNSLKRDIVGECSAILTKKYRPKQQTSTYLLCAGILFLAAFDFTCVARLILNVQAGWRGVSTARIMARVRANRGKRRVRNDLAECCKEGWLHSNDYTDSPGKGDIVHKKINIKCARQAVSHEEVIHVEEQLVIFCEQVGHGIS